MEERKQALCKRCGHKWYPSVEKPKACPYCKSYKWQIDKKETNE